jgi:hypothetical protein
MENDSVSPWSSAVTNHPAIPDASEPASGSFEQIDEPGTRPREDEDIDVFAGCALACGTIPPGQMFLP